MGRIVGVAVKMAGWLRDGRFVRVEARWSGETSSFLGGDVRSGD
jgi:hypothetical protein